MKEKEIESERERENEYVYTKSIILRLYSECIFSDFRLLQLVKDLIACLVVKSRDSVRGGRRQLNTCLRRFES